MDCPYGRLSNETLTQRWFGRPSSTRWILEPIWSLSEVWLSLALQVIQSSIIFCVKNEPYVNKSVSLWKYHFFHVFLPYRLIRQSVGNQTFTIEHIVVQIYIFVFCWMCQEQRALAGPASRQGQTNQRRYISPLVRKTTCDLKLIFSSYQVNRVFLPKCIFQIFGD